MLVFSCAVSCFLRLSPRFFVFFALFVFQDINLVLFFAFLADHRHCQPRPPLHSGSGDSGCYCASVENVRSILVWLAWSKIEQHLFRAGAAEERQQPQVALATPRRGTVKYRLFHRNVTMAGRERSPPRYVGLYQALKSGTR